MAPHSETICAIRINPLFSPFPPVQFDSRRKIFPTGGTHYEGRNTGIFMLSCFPYSQQPLFRFGIGPLTNSRRFPIRVNPLFSRVFFSSIRFPPKIFPTGD